MSSILDLVFWWSMVSVRRVSSVFCLAPTVGSVPLEWEREGMEQAAHRAGSAEGDGWGLEGGLVVFVRLYVRRQMTRGIELDEAQRLP